MQNVAWKPDHYLLIRDEPSVTELLEINIRAIQLDKPEYRVDTEILVVKTVRDTIRRITQNQGEK